LLPKKRIIMSKNTTMRVYDKKFIIYCYGEHWHINWLKNSDVTLEEFFKHHDVEIVDTDIDGEEIDE
jgi:hypothetical protein